MLAGLIMQWLKKGARARARTFPARAGNPVYSRDPLKNRVRSPEREREREGGRAEGRCTLLPMHVRGDTCGRNYSHRARFPDRRGTVRTINPVIPPAIARTGRDLAALLPGSK